MDYVRLGRTGLKVSRLCLGCMTYGEPDRGAHEWSLNEEASRPLFRQAFEAGINFFDTANIYSDGTSEEFLGRAVREFSRREDVVIATKLNSPMRKDPNAAGLSRKAVMTEIDASLKRLGTDYVDLYQIHRFDYSTPIEETLEALHDVVKAGKARYIGASSMYAYQFCKALYLADRHGWTRFVSMQNHYNLLYREDERELIPICKEQGVALTPYSPLAAGRLSRLEWKAGTLRSQTDKTAISKYDSTQESDYGIVLRVDELARKYGATMTQIALAWHLAKSVTSPIIGATKAKYFDDAAGALDIVLTAEDVAYLEELYVPHRIVGAL